MDKITKFKDGKGCGDMNHREWLHRAFDLAVDIRSDDILLAQHRADAEYTSPKMVRGEGQDGSGKNRTELMLEGLIGLEQRILSNKKQSERLKSEIYEAIVKVKDVRYREILKYRYIECLTMPLIAQRMGYSERNVRRKLRRAEDMVVIG